MSDKTPSHKSVVVPVEPDAGLLSVVSAMVRRIAVPVTVDPDEVYFDNGHARQIYKAITDVAPAPSSLAGGEAMKSLRFIANMERDTDRLGSVMVANWIIQDLAALSPEAPARDGVEWFGVTGAADETEALAVALFDVRCPGIRMTDEDLHYYRAAAQRAMKAVADELDTPALTPRHEAPASEGTFQFDTTGAIDTAPGDNDRGHLVWWHSLDAFTQGYIEAMLSTGRPLIPLRGDSQNPFRAPAFSDLAAETLAQIIADCEAIMAAKPALYDQIHDGKMVWQNRQAGFGGGFEPLTVQLSDDGKVRFA